MYSSLPYHQYLGQYLFLVPALGLDDAPEITEATRGPDCPAEPGWVAAGRIVDRYGSQFLKPFHHRMPPV